MKEVLISDSKLKEAAATGNDAFIDVFVDAINAAINGELSAGNMAELGSDQITLLAYKILRDEVMSGGFVQLIHNGYGAFMFRNPFGRALREWGLRDLYKVIDKVHSIYNEIHEDVERDCSDDEFMALYEKYPKLDDYDDYFVTHEDEWTNDIAHYVDGHVDNFAKIVGNE